MNEREESTDNLHKGKGTLMPCMKESKGTDALHERGEALMSCMRGGH